MARTTKGKRTISETVLDLGKLTFGGVVLGGVFGTGMNKIALIIIGTVFVVVAMFVGVHYVT